MAEIEKIKELTENQKEFLYEMIEDILWSYGYDEMMDDFQKRDTLLSQCAKEIFNMVNYTIRTK